VSWWGKLVGGAFGFLLGGPLGAVLGAALGHGFDRGMGGLPRGAEATLNEGDRERVQTAFFTATFSVLGNVAKVDGQVSKDEIRLAEAVMDEMNLSADMRRAAINLFNQGKAADFPLDEVLAQFRQECHGRTTLIQLFLEIQLQAAYADGDLHPAESALLQSMCDQLGFSRMAFAALDRMIRAERAFRGGPGAGQGRAGGGRAQADLGRPSLQQAYDLLGVKRDASDAEVKRAYRRLLSQHHPDKLVSKGLPEEMMKIAAQKTHEIRQAYERIKEARGS
jgi:DnaJ like chaperone protein